MTVKIERDIIAAIEAILKRGHDAVVYRSKDGVVVAEQSRHITYRTVQKSEQ